MTKHESGLLLWLHSSLSHRIATSCLSSIEMTAYFSVVDIVHKTGNWKGHFSTGATYGETAGKFISYTNHKKPKSSRFGAFEWKRLLLYLLSAYSWITCWLNAIPSIVNFVRKIDKNPFKWHNWQQQSDYLINKATAKKTGYACTVFVKPNRLWDRYKCKSNWHVQIFT